MLKKMKKLILLANKLDKIGRTKDANYIDTIIKKYAAGIVPKETLEYISDNISKEDENIHISELGDFSELDDTNISPGEAFGVGFAAAKHDKETHHGGKSYMAKPQLARIEEAAREAYHFIEEGEELPDWMESNIAKAEHIMDSVYKSLKHKKGLYGVQGMIPAEFRVPTYYEDESEIK
tara:strand:- start:162 stop:698 length:537 start_codon:yes stop_codon:yes gene_type:complete